MEQLDSLTRLQEELGKRISQLLSNMKKDSSSRKNKEYYEKKLQLLKEYWAEVNINHGKMEKLKIPEHQYFEVKYYEQIKERYEAAIAYIEENQEKLQKSSQQIKSTILNLDIEDENQDIQEKRKWVKIKRLSEKIENIDKELTENKSKIRYESLLKKLNADWDVVVEMQEEISVKKIQDGNNDITDEDFKNLEARIEKIKEELEEKINVLSTSNVEARQNKIRLPQIKLPIFNGNYEEWTTFHDLFEKIINQNIELTQTEKMHYLKTHVQKEPSKIIQHLIVSENNYLTAWNLLKNRYHNKRLIINKLLEKILEFPNIYKESPWKLKRLHDTVMECLQAIDNLDIDTSSWGPIIAYTISKKWDQETNKLYEQSVKNPNEVQEFSSMMQFLLTRFQSLEATQNSRKQNEERIEERKRMSQCKICRQNHNIIQCKKFQEMSVDQRIEIINEKKICWTCLKHEKTEKCFSKINCFKCQKNHHTMLHKDRRPQGRQYNAKEQNQSSTNQVVSHIGRQDQTILLATALIKVETNQGTTEILRALIDSGSQASFITEQAAQILSIPKQKIHAEVTGLGEGQPKVSSAKIVAKISPRFSSNFDMHSELLVLKQLTKQMPSNQLDQTKEEEWKNRILADPTYYMPGPIDIILGAQEYTKIVLEGLHKTNCGILGQNTEIGWILSGTAKEIENRKIEVTSMIARIEEDKQLSKFWELEEVSNIRVKTQEEQECEEFYQQTTVRNQDGTYTVRIPFKTETVDLGTSKPRATARLLQLERKFKNNKELHEQYKQFMKEYIDLGHMTLIPKEKENEEGYYIPHQAVIREESTTTKLRVVFDASSKSSNRISLNEIMHTGPRLQQELTDILIRWRKHKIVFSADVEKMYRQIKIHNEDQKYQKILWRFDMQQPIREYTLTTVTYGTAAAPYLAIKTLTQIAKDEAENYPKAAEVSKQDFYVDDVLSGAETRKEAMQLQTELIQMLHSAGMSLRKWLSNDVSLIEHLPEELRDQKLLEMFQDGTRKSLGINWAPNKDIFCFKSKGCLENTPTKRFILSEISTLFDPLGWLAPIVIRAKMIIQELWKQELEWDQPVPQKTEEEWKKFSKELEMVNEFNLPRWIHYEKKQEIELHGFCDSSEKAYGAVIYSRTTDKIGKIHVNLLVAKSKVTPIKTKPTLPRLELCAAELLAKLIKRTVTALDIENIKIFAWTDSMITLGWIRGEPQKWKTFVANRVSKIQALIGSQYWYHVKTNENPADLISRGLEVYQLKINTLWWNGPSWLKEKEIQINEEKQVEITEEKKKCFKIRTQYKENNTTIERFSNLSRMTRVLSYCKRFINRIQKKKEKVEEKLTVKEINDTLHDIIKIVQQEVYKKEINTLKKKKYLDKTEKLSTLCPFIDNEGILRIGGRLQNSTLSYNEKHPIILPTKHNLTTMIIQNAHEITLHGGTQSTLAFIRRKYWIVNGKKTVGTLINKCVKCIRYKNQTAQQLMGNLPAPRVTPSSPFTHTGVDYAGPIQIRATKGRGHKSYKGYIAVFVCLSTKAIHLEVVSDLTTDTFLAAFKRFTARRGQCAHLYSDNGTTFIGAKKLVSTAVEKIATIGTQWHFIPPSAPHFGGLWEAGVKSMKHHLKRIIGDTTLTYEELTTLIYQIEACLNSRPLYPLSETNDDIIVLTPGHFLIGKPILTPLEVNNEDMKITPISRWHIIQKMKKDFWKAWSSEYLGRLQQRYKWKSNCENIKPGDVVLIKEDNINPNKWPLARISEVCTGSDEAVRVVKLKQSNGNEFKRAIHKLIPLPTVEEQEKIQPQKISTNIGTVSRKQNKNKSLYKFIFIMLISSLIQNTVANYIIKKPHPGLYVEHIGQGRIERGVFRIQLSFNKTKISDDARAISSSINKIEDMCTKAEALTKEIQCNNLIHHLKEKEKQFDWVIKGMEGITQRKRRGVLGNLLTAIFGVNEEVYQDINALEQNQHKLATASNHQTKFMLSALATFNNTEIRINKHLEHFQERLSQGLEAINHMQNWYSVVDRNHLKIHILSTYQVAYSYIDELIVYYSKLLNVHLNKGHLYELITPAHVKHVLAEASKKIPQNIEILVSPVLKTVVKHNETFINVFGYFPISEITEFTLIKVTPIPFKIQQSSYWIMNTPNDILAINYNTQTYFQLTDEEFKSSIKLQNHKYLCVPAVVKSIENSPNCIIDEIYHRENSLKCGILENPIKSTIWKQMYMANTWLFITATSTRIAVTCNGEREDVTINGTGLIQISQDCIIQTKQNVLAAKRLENISVLAGMSKTITIPIETFEKMPTIKEVKDEPVIKASDGLNDLKKEEEDIQQENHTIQLKRLHYHSILNSSMTLLIFIGIIIAGWSLSTRCKKKEESPSQQGHAVELQPLYDQPIRPEVPSRQNV